jgi:hypothetical protein
MFSKIIVSALIVIASVLSISAQSITTTPAGVTPFSMIGHDAMREQAIKTNTPYIRIVRSLLSVISDKNDLNESRYSEYINFFENPTTSSYLFASATRMIELSYNNASGLVDYIADSIFAGSDLGTAAVAQNHTKITLSKADIVRNNAKTNFNSEVTSAALKAILATAMSAEQDSVKYSKRAPISQDTTNITTIYPF